MEGRWSLVLDPGFSTTDKAGRLDRVWHDLSQTIFKKFDQEYKIYSSL
jgi:hypothetical protein